MLICLAIMVRCPRAEKEDWGKVLDPRCALDYTTLVGGEMAPWEMHWMCC